MRSCPSKPSRLTTQRSTILRICARDDPMSRLQSAAENSENAVMIASNTGRITYINPAFEALTGFSSKEVCGQNAAIFNAETHDQHLLEHDELWLTLNPGQNSKEFPRCFINRKKSGELFFIEQIIRPFVALDGSTTHYVWTGRDISQRVSALRQLAQQANHDDLTGLSNRNLFMDRLSQAFSQASRRKDRFALLYVDLDEFKEVNDRQGHAAGDELLRTAARRLRQSVREVDTVARLGGDEFALILPDAKQREDVEKVTQKILQAFQIPVMWQGKLLVIRASIGASLYPENADSCEQLLHHADHAMYQQKIAGGNGVSFFRQPMNATDEAAYLIL